jgi:ketopantoate reductase
MNLIRRRVENLEERASGGEIRSFEDMMSECCKIADALREGTKLDSLKFKRFSPAMKAGLAKALPDMERAMCDALENQGWLPLEVTAQLILIYRDPDARDLLTPTLLELIEHILALERAGGLAVGAE